MAVKPVIGVSGVGIGVIAAEVITGSCVLKQKCENFEFPIVVLSWGRQITKEWAQNGHFS